MAKIAPLFGFILLVLSAQIVSGLARASEPLTMGIVSLFPLGTIGADGTAEGLYPDIANAVAVKSGINIVNTVQPFRRIYREVINGDIDLFVSFRRKDLEKSLMFLGSVGCTKMLAITRKGSEVTSLEALSGRKVGFVQGSSLGMTYAEEYGVIPVYVPSNVSLVNLLVRKHLEQFIVNAMVYNSYYQGLATDIGLPENWQASMSEPMTVDVYDIQVSISRRSVRQNQADRIRNAVRTLQQEDGFSHLFRKWGNKDGGDCQGLTAY